MTDLNDSVAKMGNDILMLVALSKSIAIDYDELLSKIPSGSGRIEKEKSLWRDRVVIEHRDKDGNLKSPPFDSGWSTNGITNTGFAEVAGLITADVGGTSFDYIAIGTGTTSFDPSQTALITEIKRKGATGTRTTTSVTNDTAQYVATFSSADGLSGTSAVTESGVFNASSSGTMLCRQTFSAYNCNWDSGDSLQVTWKVQVKQGT